MDGLAAPAEPVPSGVAAASETSNTHTRSSSAESVADDAAAAAAAAADDGLIVERFRFRTTIAVQPPLRVGPTDLDFGLVPIFLTKNRSFTIRCGQCACVFVCVSGKKGFYLSLQAVLTTCHLLLHF